MKGDAKKILIGSFVIAVLLIAASFKFMYLADVEKTEQVQNEINQKQERLNELNQKNANRTRYESGIANSQDIIDTVLSVYGPGNTPEKSIMMIVELCKMTGVTVSDIAFQGSTNVYSSERLNENGNPEVQIYQGSLQLVISSGYTQLKKLTDYINSYPERMNAENFSVGFDAETGRLTITMKVNLFGVTDDKHKYEDPVIEDIELGTTNIFKAAEILTEEEGEEVIENGEVTEVTPNQNTNETQEE